MRKNIWPSLFVFCLILGEINFNEGLQASDVNPDSVLIKKCQDFNITVRTRHATSVTGGIKESGNIVSGWIAEFFIPYKLLAPLSRVPPLSGTRWRANMYRIDYDNGIVPYSWQKTDKTFHDYNKFGTFIFE